MRFFEAAADWADRKAVDIKFSRDDMDGWFAILSFSDSRGPFSAVVNELKPRGKDFHIVKGEKVPVPAESEEEFATRVGVALDKACVAARKDRIRVITRTRSAA